MADESNSRSWWSCLCVERIVGMRRKPYCRPVDSDSRTRWRLCPASSRPSRTWNPGSESCRIGATGKRADRSVGRRIFLRRRISCGLLRSFWAPPPGNKKGWILMVVLVCPFTIRFRVIVSMSDVATNTKAESIAKYVPRNYGEIRSHKHSD